MASNVHVKIGDAVITPIGKGVVVAAEDWDVWVKIGPVPFLGNSMELEVEVCFDVSEIERTYGKR
jgi:hypothetical protein